MPRDLRAYLEDILEACDAIRIAVNHLSQAEYSQNRLIRSSVEREFIIIGEAVSNILRLSPDLAATISRSRRIVDFRNRLTHEYPTVDDELVWAVIQHDVPILQRDAAHWMKKLDREVD